MIAKNFVKYPEALRFQREMFSNGYHNSPRIMRLMECVFDWSATVPDWWKEAKGRARSLAKQVRKSIADFFKETKVIQLVLKFPSEGMTYTLPEATPPKLVNKSPRGNPTLIPWTDRAGVTVQSLDAPVYMSYCNNHHEVQYAWNKYAPYWGGDSA